jgi:hypothetical protein
MQASVPLIPGRPPPEQHAQFVWIVETVAGRTNELRGNLCLISAQSLFDPRPGPYTKSPRLLSVYLARKLLGWPYSTINAIYSPSSYPHSTNLTTQARKWVSSGCFDALSGRSMAPIKDHAFNAFAAGFFQPLQNPSGSGPDGATAVIAAVAGHFSLTKTALLLEARSPVTGDPSRNGKSLMRPRRKSAGRARTTAMKTKQQPINDVELKREPGHLVRKAMALEGAAGEPDARSGQLVQSRQAAGGARAILPVPSSLPALQDSLTAAPFIHQLHPRLIEAARAIELSVREFIADMIAEAMEQKAAVSPLAPLPFLQVLASTSLHMPEHLVPHAMLIQRTLYDFAKLLPTRASLQAPAAVIRSLKRFAARAGD